MTVPKEAGWGKRCWEYSRGTERDITQARALGVVECTGRTKALWLEVPRSECVADWRGKEEKPGGIKKLEAREVGNEVRSKK